MSSDDPVLSAKEWARQIASLFLLPPLPSVIRPQERKVSIGAESPKFGRGEGRIHDDE